MAISYRRWNDDDDVEALTVLLHRAYRELADAGMRFTASWQPSTVTVERLEHGETHLAVDGSRHVGTITWYTPTVGEGCEWYERPEVAHFGQYGVDPDYRALGIGRKLLEVVEERAASWGAQELALDTSERADRLISMYSRRGYRFIQYIAWNTVNYRSVVLSKSLAAGPYSSNF